MKKIDVFINQEKIEEVVNKINKAFICVDESETDFQAAAEDALLSFFENYLAYGLKEEKWSLKFGSSDHLACVGSDWGKRELTIDIEKLAMRGPDDRQKILAQIFPQLVRVFYQSVLLHYEEMRSDKEDGENVSDKVIADYERFIGKELAQHCHNCYKGAWGYEQGAKLAKVFGLATGEREFFKIAHCFNEMSQKEEKMMEDDFDDAEYRSWAFFPSVLYKDVAVDTILKNLLSDMMNHGKSVFEGEINADSEIFISVEAINKLHEELKKNKKNIEGEWVDNSDQSLKLGKTALMLADKFNETIYINYLVALCLSGEKMTPANTEGIVRTVFSCRGQVTGAEEFMQNVTQLANERREDCEDEELDSIYATISYAHRIITGDITEEELAELRSAADDEGGGEDYDDDYDDEDDGAGI